MLRQRPAGDKSWPIACSHTTLGEGDEELDLTGAHLSYGDFEGATFAGGGEGAIKLSGAGFAHAHLSGSKIIAFGYASHYGDATIDFTQANLTNADLRGSEITAYAYYSGDATIDFTEADLTNADLSGSEIFPYASYGDATIDFTEADLTNADLSGLKLTADSIIGLSPPPKPSPPSLPSPPSPSPPPTNPSPTNPLR